MGVFETLYKTRPFHLLSQECFARISKHLFLSSIDENILASDGLYGLNNTLGFAHRTRQWFLPGEIEAFKSKHLNHPSYLCLLKVLCCCIVMGDDQLNLDTVHTHFLFTTNTILTNNHTKLIDSITEIV